MPKAADLCRIGPRFMGQPYSKMDCQAFVEKCLQEIGIQDNLPGSNAWYRRMTWTGTPEECKASFGRIPPGAFLFILKHDGNEPEKYKSDGIGNASHIGIYTGMTGKEMCAAAAEAGVKDAERFNFGDGAINSSSTHASVCTSKVAGKAISGGWNRVGLWDRLSYDIDLDPEGSDESMTATVWASSGATVNLRSKPSAAASLVDQVPIGSTVTVISTSDDWSTVNWCGKKGYMMTKFLIFGTVQPGEDDTVDKDTITVSRARLMAVYSELGAILGVVG